MRAQCSFSGLEILGAEGDEAAGEVALRFRYQVAVRGQRGFSRASAAQTVTERSQFRRDLGGSWLFVNSSEVDIS